MIFYFLTAICFLQFSGIYSHPPNQGRYQIPMNLDMISELLRPLFPQPPFSVPFPSVPGSKLDPNDIFFNAGIQALCKALTDRNQAVTQSTPSPSSPSTLSESSVSSTTKAVDEPATSTP